MELFVADVQNDTAYLNEEESVHCVRVLRHREGDSISVIDGSGTLYLCKLSDDSPKSAIADIVSRSEDFGGHPYSLTMAVCPTKNIDRYEWFVEKATEIGVDTIVPVIGDHSERRTVNADRLRRLLVSASKQSLKGKIPFLAPVCSVSEFIRSVPADELRLICHCSEDEGERRNIKEVLGDTNGRKISILIGPEGDFSSSEVRLAISSGWIPVTLGESRLRTETAATLGVTAVYLGSM